MAATALASSHSVSIGRQYCRIDLDIALDPHLPTPLPEQLRVQVVQQITAKAPEKLYFSRYYVDRSDNLDNPEMHSIVLKSLQRVIASQQGPADEKLSIDWALAQELESANCFQDDGWEHIIEQLGCSDEWVQSLSYIASDYGFDLDDAAGDYDDFETFVRQTVFEVVTNADDSKPTDILSHVGEIRLVYTPRNGDDASLESNMIDFDSITSDPYGVIPNPGFRQFLELLNISPMTFISGVKKRYDVDLLEDDGWQEFISAPIHLEPKRASAVSEETLFELLDNMGLNANPTFVIAIPPSSLEKMGPGKVLLCDGGQIGAHCFINGSGHLVSAEGPVVVPADISLWRPENGPDKIGRWSVDDVYGMAGSAYQGEITVVDIEPRQQRELALKFSR